MANIFLFTTIAIVVSTSVNCERRAFLRNANNLPKVLHNLKHDKEELNENLVKNEGQPREEMRMGPRPPPLYPNYPAQWLFGAHQNHLSDKEHTQQRIQQLQNKLNNQPPNRIPKQTLNQPHPKPEIEVKLYENHRHKREATQLENDFRQKRDVVINPHMQPEVVMQPHIQPALLQEIEAKNVRPSLNLHIYNPSIYYPDIVESIVNKSGHHEEKDAEKRDKRQILLLIKQQPLKLGKKPRTTPNPFIRETNIADYDIGKTNVDKPEIDTIDTVDTDSYELNEEASEFSNTLSNFYLTTNPEYWPEIQKFSENVLKPLSELLDSGRETNYFTNLLQLNSNDRNMATEKMETNRRVKRNKTLIRKRLKKRKQKQRRVERKRLRMLTHARRLRKQRKSKLARLERHYARMNLTTTMPPSHPGEHTISEGKVNETARHETDVVVTSNGQSVEQLDSESEYDTESDSEYYNTESDSDDEHEEDGESDIGSDNGNDEYEEEYDEESSSSHEYVDYENVVDESSKAKENKNKKESNKKQAGKKEINKKKNNKTRNNKKEINLNT